MSIASRLIEKGMEKGQFGLDVQPLLHIYLLSKSEVGKQLMMGDF
jgi:hypothetical protein